MRRLRSPLLSACLGVLLIVLGGVLSAQVVPHVSKHAQHHSGTHATTLCSWYCAAGHVHAGELVVVVAPILSFLLIEQWQPMVVTAAIVKASPSRAPPSA